MIVIFYIVQWYFDLCNYITFIIWVYQLIYFTLNIFGLIIGKGCYLVLVMTNALLARLSKPCNNHFLKRFFFHFMIKYITVWLAVTISWYTNTLVWYIFSLVCVLSDTNSNNGKGRRKKIWCFDIKLSLASRRLTTTAKRLVERH